MPYNIPQFSDELLLRAAKRPNIANVVESGVSGLEKGVDLSSKLQQSAMLRQKQEQDILKEIEALKQSQAKQKAAVIQPGEGKASREITPEVYKALFPEPSTPKEVTPPTGYRFKNDGSLEPIPGSEAARKLEKEAKSEKATFDQNLAKATQSKNFVESTIPKISILTSGLGAYTSIIPGSPARNIKSDIQEIKSRLGLDALLAAKATSPTGASGFGQLSDKEMEILQAQVANLDQAQSPQQLRDKLSKIVQHYNNVLSLIQGTNPYNANNPAPEGVSIQLSPNQRFDELIKSGMTEEQAYRKLAEEGY